jgi:cytochrome c oxidase assembly factor CtaG
LRIAATPLRLATPLVAWGLHAAALWIWHVPRLFDGAVASDWVHGAQHASFFFTALVFWWAVFRRVRTGLAVLMVLTTMMHMGALGALLTFAPAPLYADTSLDAQQLGGLVMWVPAGYAMMAAGVIAFGRLLGRELEP